MAPGSCYSIGCIPENHLKLKFYDNSPVCNLLSFYRIIINFAQSDIILIYARFQIDETSEID